MHDHMEDYLHRLSSTIEQLPRDRIARLGSTLLRAYKNDKQVFTLGNGGSASTASHMAADLAQTTIAPNMRRFRITSVNENMSILTAVANDIGYAHVFSKQLSNVICAGDVLIAVSASGNSPNVLEAMRYSQRESAEVVALLGFDGGEAASLADNAIVVPSSDYGIVEDLHLAINHMIVEHFKTHLAGLRSWLA
jgi:D-sedoheptulose 7-phosphate isomerase